MAESPKKVFISYSWTSVEHENWVVELAKRLMSDGVLVVIDKWDWKEGQDKYTFMEQMVVDPTIDKVLIVSDKRYSEKADKREGGVGTESQIISDEVYKKVDQDKFIPIITECDDKKEPYLPVFLKSRKYINLSDPSTYMEEYEKILRNIYNRPLYQKPLLGTPPEYIVSDEQQPSITLHKFQTLLNAIEKEKPYAAKLSKEYLNLLLEAYDQIAIDKTVPNIDDEVINSIHLFKSYRDQFIEYVEKLCSYEKEMKYFEYIRDFIEKSLSYYFPKNNVSSYSLSWYDNYRFITYELFLYLITILMNNDRFDVMDLFLGENYCFYANHEYKNVGFSFINQTPRSLDEFRNNRLQLRRASITADLIKERCDSRIITFEQIMQTDLILMLKSLTQKPLFDKWRPKTIIYQNEYQPFEMFIRAENKRHMNRLCKIMNFDTPTEMISTIIEVLTNNHLDQYMLPNGWPINFGNYLNLAKLQKIYLPDGISS